MQARQLRLVGEETEPEKEPAATFDDFWLLYPRRVAKKDARQAWWKLTPANQVKALDALIDWRRIYAARDDDKIPHPATWLNGERWEDELPREYRTDTTNASTDTAARAAQQTHDRKAGIPMPQRVRDLLAKLKAK